MTNPIRSPRHAAGCFCLSALLALSPAARADVVHLKNGSKVEGEITRSDDGWVVKDAAGKVTKVPASDVRTIEAKRVPDGEVASQRLEALRRSAQNLSNIDDVLARYKVFLAQNKDTPAADAARADVTLWEERKKLGVVKLGDRWVTADEKKEADAKALAAAAEAAALMGQGRVKDADAALAAALKENPHNPSALYLRGLVLARQDQLVPARKAFEEVIALTPAHAPSLNNLAVTLWRTNQKPAAVVYYEQAMAASPGDRRVLDNVAEALHALPEGQRGGQAVKKALKRFNDQDNALQAKMRRQGQYRWGSTWVDEATMEELELAEREMQDKLDALESEFEASERAVADIEDEVAETKRSIRRIEATSYSRDAGGRVMKLTKPRVYYELQRDLEDLQDDRKAELAKQDKLRKTARQVQQDLPIPRYTGLQRLIGVEGTPLLPDGALPTGPDAPADAAAQGSPGGADSDPRDAPDTPPAGHTDRRDPQTLPSRRAAKASVREPVGEPADRAD